MEVLAKVHWKISAKLFVVVDCSLDCREGHMKKNSLCVCPCVCLHQGQKNIDFSRQLLLTIDGQNIVGTWVIGVGESESGYNFGVKGQKNIGFSNY
jgi:hypothetical protein